MKYIAIVWIVIIAGALGWAGYSRVPSLIQSFKPDAEAASVDESVAAASKRADILLRNSPGRGFRPKTTIEAKVTKVLSGDTIEVEIAGETVIVGYLGVDAPDIDNAVFGTQPFGEEAFNRNKELVEGKTVQLERDFIEQSKDGQMLRYVYVDDLMVNVLLLHEGLAKTHDYARGLKYAEVIYDLQSQAIIGRRGGWRTEWPNLTQTR